MVVAVEFQANIDDGKIEIPDPYRAQLGQHVRVILLAEAEPRAAGSFERLFQNPPRTPDFVPLSRGEAHER